MKKPQVRAGGTFLPSFCPGVPCVTLCVMTNARTTGKKSEQRRAAELESVAKFVSERCEASPSEFSAFRDLFSAYKQFHLDVSRETREIVEASAKQRPGWDSLTLGEQALIRVDLTDALGPQPVDMGPGMFSIALIRIGHEPIRRRARGYPGPIMVVPGLRLRDR